MALDLYSLKISAEKAELINGTIDAIDNLTASVQAVTPNLSNFNLIANDKSTLDNVNIVGTNIDNVKTTAMAVTNKVSTTVDTIDALRALTITPSSVWVSGYYTKGDGAFGSHIFEWDATSIESDNGGTIIKLNGVTTGRYKLKYDRAVNVKWFGAVGDGVTDDASAIQNAILFGGEILINTGVYYISSSIKVEKNTTIKGQGWCNTDNSIWYSGKPIVGKGTAIINGGEWSAFELIGIDNTDENKVTKCIIRDLEIYCEPSLDADGTIGRNKPRYATSTCISSHNGSGHKIDNIRVAGFGYAGIELGINRVYNGITYSAIDSSGGRGNNSHVSNSYYSSGFGVGILVFNEQCHFTNVEGDSYQDNQYSGWTNPNTGVKESWGFASFNSVGLFINSCHFEAHYQRSGGLLIDRLTGEGTYPTQINILGCKFYGGIIGIYIGSGVLGSSIVSSNFDGTFGTNSIQIDGDCTVGNSTIAGSASTVQISNGNSIIDSCIFKDILKAIDVTYRGNITDNSFINCSTGVFVSATSTNGIKINNNTHCIIDLNGLPILDSMFINDNTLGVCTTGLSGIYKHSISSTKSIDAGGSTGIVQIVATNTAYKNQTTVVKVKSIYDGVQNDQSSDVIYSKVVHALNIYYTGANFDVTSSLVDKESNSSVTNASDVTSTSNPSTGTCNISSNNPDTDNSHYVRNYIEITGAYYGFKLL